MTFVGQSHNGCQVRPLVVNPGAGQQLRIQALGWSDFGGAVAGGFCSGCGGEAFFGLGSGVELLAGTVVDPAVGVALDWCAVGAAAVVVRRAEGPCSFSQRQRFGLVSGG